MYAVRCQNLTKRFETRKTLRDLTFDFPAGEITAIVGESGCGKTTLLRLIAGRDAPQEGSIAFVRGDDGENARPVVSTVFQEPRLFPWLTAAQNVALAVRHLPEREQTARVAEALAAVGLLKAADKYPQELSGGMAQRTGLARALCRRPDVLLLDESFSALDALTRERVRLQFLAITETRPMTVILVTHDVPEAVLLSRTVCKLENGRIARTWRVEAPYPRTLGQRQVSGLTDDILQSFFEPTHFFNGVAL